MWSVLETLRKRRAVLFWTFCSLFRRYWGQPERRELQHSRHERTKGSYKSLCGICGQKMADRTNATEHTDWRLGFSWSSGSQVSHQFLTEPDKGTDALPTVIESGKGKERDLDFLPEDTIIASVLSSLSLFSISQDLMSSVHFCVEMKRSGILWGDANSSSESSAYEWWRTGVLFNYSRKRTGPITYPCGTPKEMGAGSDV